MSGGRSPPYELGVSMDVGHLIAVGQILVTTVVAVIGGLMRRTLADIDRRYEGVERRLTALEEDAVRKEEYIREVAANRIRLEKVLDELHELKGHQQAANTIASMIAEALARRAGKADDHG